MCDEGTKPQLQIPLTRTKVIMKSSPEVDIVTQDAVITMSKAAEMFIVELVQMACKPETKEITYSDLSDLLTSHEELSFLADVLPAKIKAKEWMEKYKHLF